MRLFPLIDRSSSAPCTDVPRPEGGRTGVAIGDRANGLFGEFLGGVVGLEESEVAFALREPGDPMKAIGLGPAVDLGLGLSMGDRDRDLQIARSCGRNRPGIRL
jgi:hypothetical protein